jgi:hypothetical protein
MKVKRYENSGVRYGEFLDSQRKPTKSGGLVGDALSAAQRRKLEIARWKNGQLSISIEDPFIPIDAKCHYAFVITEKELIAGIKKLPKQ